MSAQLLSTDRRVSVSFGTDEPYTVLIFHNMIERFLDWMSPIMVAVRQKMDLAENIVSHRQMLYVYDDCVEMILTLGAQD